MVTIKIRQTYGRVYRQCKRKYDLAVNHKLVRKEKHPALSIGTAAHAGRATWLKTWDTASALTAANDSITAEVLNFPALDKPHDTKVCTYKPCVACARRIVIEVIALYTTKFPSRFSPGSIQVLAIEQPFEYILARHEELEMILTGTLDAAIMWGPYFLNFEFKTTAKQLPIFFETEYLSVQHKTYCMALQSLYPERPVYGTIVDAVRKPGKTFAPESDHILLPIDSDEIAELRRDYEELLKEISYSMETNYYPPNFDNCFSIRGQCEFYGICKSRFNPRVIQENFDVVDDLKQIVEGEDEPATGN